MIKSSAQNVDQRVRAKKAAVALGFGACDTSVNSTLEDSVIEIQEHGDRIHIVVEK